MRAAKNLIRPWPLIFLGMVTLALVAFFTLGIGEPVEIPGPVKWPVVYNGTAMSADEFNAIRREVYTKYDVGLVPDVINRTITVMTEDYMRANGILHTSEALKQVLAANASVNVPGSGRIISGLAAPAADYCPPPEWSYNWFYDYPYCGGSVIGVPDGHPGGGSVPAVVRDLSEWGAPSCPSGTMNNCISSFLYAGNTLWIILYDLTYQRGDWVQIQQTSDHVHDLNNWGWANYASSLTSQPY